MKTVVTSASFVKLTNFFLNTGPLKTLPWIMCMDQACRRGLKLQKCGANVKAHRTLPSKRRGISNSKTTTSRHLDVSTTIQLVVPILCNPSSIRNLTYTAQRMRQRYKPSCSGTRRGSRLLGPGNSLRRTHSPEYRRPPLRFVLCRQYFLES